MAPPGATLLPAYSAPSASLTQFGEGVWERDSEESGRGERWERKEKGEKTVETGKEEKGRGKGKGDAPFEKTLDPPRILRNKSELKLSKIANVSKTKNNSKTYIALTLHIDSQVTS